MVLSPPVRQQRPDPMLGQTRQVPQSPPCWPGAEPPRGPADAGDTRADSTWAQKEGRAGHSSGGSPRSLPGAPRASASHRGPWAGGSLCITVGRLSPPPEGRECEEWGVQPMVGTCPGRHPIVSREQALSPQMPMIRAQHLPFWS